MLRKTNDQSKIGFLDGIKFPSKEEQTVLTEEQKYAELRKEQQIKSAAEDIRVETLKEEQKSKKLNCKDDGLMSSKSIASAYYNPDPNNGISDFGGPSKQLKTPISNSIWEPDRANKATLSNSKEETRLEKESIASVKLKQEKERINNMVEALKSTDQTKASAINVMNSFQGHKFNTSQQNIGIFDNGDFNRLPKQTDGERVAQENSEKRAQKDESWRTDGKSFSSKDVINRMFDGLMSSKDKKE